jgi:hypothetical protein
MMDAALQQMLTVCKVGGSEGGTGSEASTGEVR